MLRRRWDWHWDDRVDCGREFDCNAAVWDGSDGSAHVWRDDLQMGGDIAGGYLRARSTTRTDLMVALGNESWKRMPAGREAPAGGFSCQALRCGLEVYVVRDGTEQFIGGFFFAEDRIEDLGMVREVEEVCPVAERSVDGNLMMLNLLGRGDKRNVANAGIGGVLDAVLGFCGEAVDDLTGDDFGFDSEVAQKGIDL